MIFNILKSNHLYTVPEFYNIFIEKTVQKRFTTIFYDNFTRLTLYRNSFVLYYTKNQESYRYNLNIRLKNLSKEDLASIKTQLKKRKFPRQLDDYHNFIESETARLEKIITDHKVEFGKYPTVKELRDSLEDGDVSLNSEFISIFKIYLSEREQDFQNRKSNTSIKDYVSFQNGILDYQQEKKTTLKIKEVNLNFLRSYFQFLLEPRPEGMGFRTKGGLNGRTIKKRFDVLKNFFKWLSNRGIDKYEEISDLINKNNIFDLKQNSVFLCQHQRHSFQVRFSLSIIF